MCLSCPTFGNKSWCRSKHFLFLILPRMHNMAKTVLVWNQLQPIPPVVDNSWVSYPQYGIFARPLVVCELKPSQLYGALPPWPHHVLCPWTSLGTPPQTVVIGWRGVLEIDWFWGQKVKRQGHETQKTMPALVCALLRMPASSSYRLSLHSKGFTS